MSLCIKQRAEFIEKLPNKPYCAENYKKTTVIRSKSHAIQYAHIQINTPFVFNHIILDIDYPVSDPQTQLFIWESNNLPEPTYAVMNPATMSAHLIFTLDEPVYKNNEKQYGFYDDVKKILTRIYNADINYKATLTKNPLDPRWKTLSNETTYTLAELKAYTPPEIRKSNVIQFNKFKRHTIDNNTSQLGRNCRLFENTRIKAYGMVHNYSSLDAFHEAILETALNFNHDELSHNEVKDTAKSIAYWTWKNRDRLKSITRQRVTSIQELRSRQSKAATTTAAAKQAKTIAAIKQAINSIVTGGVAMPSITKEAIAKLSGKSISTIKRYAAEIDRFIRCAYQDYSQVLGSLKKESSTDLPAHLNATLGRGGGKTEGNACGTSRKPFTDRFCSPVFPVTCPGQPQGDASSSLEEILKIIEHFSGGASVKT